MKLVKTGPPQLFSIFQCALQAMTQNRLHSGCKTQLKYKVLNQHPMVQLQKTTIMTTLFTRAFIKNLRNKLTLSHQLSDSLTWPFLTFLEIERNSNSVHWQCHPFYLCCALWHLLSSTYSDIITDHVTEAHKNRNLQASLSRYGIKQDSLAWFEIVRTEKKMKKKSYKFDHEWWPSRWPSVDMTRMYVRSLFENVHVM